MGRVRPGLLATLQVALERAGQFFFPCGFRALAWLFYTGGESIAIRIAFHGPLPDAN